MKLSIPHFTDAASTDLISSAPLQVLLDGDPDMVTMVDAFKLTPTTPTSSSLTPISKSYADAPGPNSDAWHQQAGSTIFLCSQNSSAHMGEVVDRSPVKLLSIYHKLYSRALCMSIFLILHVIQISCCKFNEPKQIYAAFT
jgi:hypothetical protein